MAQTALAKKRLAADARNRAVRVGLVAVLIAIFLDVWPVVNEALSKEGDVDWGSLGKAALRVGLQSLGAFVLRAILDPSKLPTPLPPEDPGPPSTEVVPDENTAVEENDEGEPEQPQEPAEAPADLTESVHHVEPETPGSVALEPAPEPLPDNDNPEPEVYEVPSADVDLIKTQVNARKRAPRKRKPKETDL